ncbi:MAG: DUF697 domain-containing protein [Synechococcales bacterium]|nr:DUF697 domain-containing protein [Synechococcales bacterium]
MAVWLRPVMWGGLILAGGILLLDGITDVLGDWVPAIVVGSGLAWVGLKIWSPAQSSPLVRRKLVSVDSVKTALVEAETVVNQVAAEIAELAAETEVPENHVAVENLRSQLYDILAELKREELRFAVMGGKGVGKTSLTKLLQTSWAADLSQKLQIQDTPALFSAAIDGGSAETQAWQQAKTADVVLFVTDGDLTETQLQAVQTLTRAYRRTLVIFNKQDQYLPKEQAEVFAKICDRLRGMIAAEDVISTATQPRPMKVRQLQADGTVKEWLEEPPAQITPLTDRLTEILLKESQKLILASSLGNVEALKVEATAQLHQIRRDRALPILDRAQWVVAGTAFATPFPAVDLLATAAINAQMVVELSNLYQQKFSLEQGKAIAKTMAELMVKLGIVEISTQAIGMVLKTNVITYVAGGAVQGVSAAYLTRLAGLTLIEYFEKNPTGAVKTDILQTILKNVFQQNQRLTFLQGFVTQAINHLGNTNANSSVNFEEAAIALPIAQQESLQVQPKLETLDMSSETVNQVQETIQETVKELV